jgi:hypothetical protein
MAITTYSELQSAAATWLIRSDLSARIPEFITLAEARLNRVLRMRRAEAEASLTATPSSRSISLPATFAEPLNLWLIRDGDREALHFRDPNLMEAQDESGEPEYWGIDSANVVFERPCDQAYSFVLRYLAKFALSDASPTNALLTDAPDVYLFATLCEAGPFLRDDTLLASFEGKLSRAIREVNAKEHRSKAMQTLSTEVAQLTGRRDSAYDITRDV